MFSILFYISLPVVFLLHDFEELFMRRKWEKNHFDEITRNYPKTVSVLSTLKNMTQLEYVIVTFEQFLFLTFAVVWGIYADPMPMCGLFWGFAVHVIVTILHAIILRVYIPGLLSSILLVPYFAFGCYDMLHQYSLWDNMIMMVCGFGVISLNLILMYLLMKKFGDLE